jgi:hypothetical protein
VAVSVRIEDLRLKMAAQSAKTGFSSESYILMLNKKKSGFFTLTNGTLMEEFFSQKFKIAPKFNIAFFVTAERNIRTLIFCIF